MESPGPTIPVERVMWDCGIMALTQCSAEEWHRRSTEAPRYSLCSRIGNPVEREKLTRQNVMSACLSGEGWQCEFSMVKCRGRQFQDIATLEPSSQSALRLVRATSLVHQTTEFSPLGLPLHLMEGQQGSKGDCCCEIVVLGCPNEVKDMDPSSTST